MRITLVIDSLACGGTEGMTSTMANFWAQRGEEVTVVTLFRGWEDFFTLHPTITRHSAEFDPVDSGNVFVGLVRNLRRVVVLRRAILESRPDVVITMVAWNNVLVLLATRGTGIPVLISEQIDPAFGSLGRIWNALRRLTYPCAGALVCPTPVIHGYYHPMVGTHGVEIPDPVWVPPWVRDRKPSERGGKKAFRLVAMGRLDQQKGFDRLLPAFKIASQRHPDWSLTIMGEGPLRRELEDQARELGIGHQVSFPGEVLDRFAVLCDSDLFVMPSRYEGFPIGLLEALACGLPAVSFDCSSGPRDIIRDGIDGVLVPPGDVNALAAALDRMMGDGAERARMAHRAPEVLQRFGLEKVMAQWDALITEILRRRKQHRTIGCQA